MSDNTTTIDSPPEPTILAGGYDPFRASFTAIENYLLDLPANQHFERPNNKFVLICILRWYNIQQAASWPTQNVLSEMTGLSIKSIQRACQQLEARGFLKIETTWHNGKRHNTYRITSKVFSNGANCDSEPVPIPTPHNDTKPTNKTLRKPPDRPYKKGDSQTKQFASSDRRRFTSYQQQQAEPTRPTIHLYQPPKDQPKFTLGKTALQRIKQQHKQQLQDIKNE